MNVLFSFGSTKDAAEFITTKSKLAWLVETQPWPAASVASMVIEDLANPTMSPHKRPTLEETNQDGTTKTRTSDDVEYKMEIEDFIADNKTVQAKKDEWDENKPRAYNLVLQHCPPKLETRLTIAWSKSEIQRRQASSAKAHGQV